MRAFLRVWGQTRHALALLSCVCLFLPVDIQEIFPSGGETPDKVGALGGAAPFANVAERGTERLLG